jgi:curved DNA-binding protein CbpA
MDLADKLLRLSRPWDILSLSGSTIKATSSNEAIRNAYLVLSFKVHPDRLTGSYQEL